MFTSYSKRPRADFVLAFLELFEKQRNPREDAKDSISIGTGKKCSKKNRVQQ
jgi:hypothetical protein